MDFSKRVYQAAKNIPKGKVSTYKEIAISLNSKAYRAVGNALNKNQSKNVPCHRVVKSNGCIGGFNGGVKKKTEMLRRDGVIARNNKIDMMKYMFKV